MKKTYADWAELFKQSQMCNFNGNGDGLLWLKVRSVCRTKLLPKFLQSSKIVLNSATIKAQEQELFEVLSKRKDAVKLIDAFLRERSNEFYQTKGIDEEKLKGDLYKVTSYSWGGDQNNSLDKYLVSHFVKTIADFDSLKGKQSVIATNSWNYVQVSWYNNWTSYLIESIFKRHPRVVSAVGEIKSVDFFLDDYPIDLKVTFFPKRFMDEELKNRLKKSELSWLKAEAKKAGIKWDNSDRTEKEMLYMLSEKLEERGQTAILNQLRDTRKQIVKSAIASPDALIEWLYKNQGSMRFGAENRLFIVLVDMKDMEQSWKMKRAFDTIEREVTHYLNHFSGKSLKTISFTYDNKAYKTLSDAIFVIKE